MALPLQTINIAIIFGC